MSTKKIYIITLQNVRNYGSVLQAFATQHIFENLGLEVGFFDYYKDGWKTSLLKRAKSYTMNDGFIGAFVKTALLIPTFIKQDIIFKKFLRKHLHIISASVTSEDDFKKLKLDADIYCTGSDQTWNSGWNNGILPPLFLSFAPEGKKCIAYSSSFGKEKLEDWEIDNTKQLLSRYSAISVREASAVDIIHRLNLGIEATHVLDPTLQVNGQFWRKLSYPVKYEKYCLFYQLNNNSKFDKFASDFAHRKGLKLLRWCNRYDQMRLPGDIKVTVPNVEYFVSLIDHADFILTDSFHCTAFSCNLNKQFLTVYPNDYNTRLASFLDLVGLQHRNVSHFDDISYMSIADIDFKPVNEILERERNKGREFLIEALK